MERRLLGGVGDGGRIEGVGLAWHTTISAGRASHRNLLARYETRRDET